MNYPAYVQNVPTISHEGKQYFAIIEKDGKKDRELYRKLLVTFPVAGKIERDGVVFHMFKK